MQVAPSDHRSRKFTFHDDISNRVCIYAKPLIASHYTLCIRILMACEQIIVNWADNEVAVITYQYRSHPSYRTSDSKPLILVGGGANEISLYFVA